MQRKGHTPDSISNSKIISSGSIKRNQANPSGHEICATLSDSTSAKQRRGESDSRDNFNFSGSGDRGTQAEAQSSNKSSTQAHPHHIGPHIRNVYSLSALNNSTSGQPPSSSLSRTSSSVKKLL